MVAMVTRAILRIGLKRIFTPYALDLTIFPNCVLFTMAMVPRATVRNIKLCFENNHFIDMIFPPPWTGLGPGPRDVFDRLDIAGNNDCQQSD